jgi:hypothetical protein
MLDCHLTLSDPSKTTMEFHRRAITKPAEGFVLLAEDNELFFKCIKYDSVNAVPSEMKGPMATSMLKAAPAYSKDIDSLELQNLETALMGPEDCDAVFSRIVDWVSER